MSDTPRTDRATTQTGLIDKLFVNADFARQLERELNGLKAEVQLMYSELDAIIQKQIANSPKP